MKGAWKTFAAKVSTLTLTLTLTLKALRALIRLAFLSKDARGMAHGGS